MTALSLDALLRIEGLSIGFRQGGRTLGAIDNVWLSLNRGEVLGLVGESGSGKSVLSLSVLRLLPSPPAEVLGGRIVFDGEDLAQLPGEQMRAIRGNRISMIFQEPMTALNPMFTAGHQIAEVFRRHRGMGRKEAFAAAIEMLRHVGVPSPETRARSFPFQLSGGMRQRVMIAMALACRPDLLIADEPTTALDVTIQAQILRLMLELREELGTAVIIITHDLGVIAETADRVAVMYAGNIVETAPVTALLAAPLHPYTQALLTAAPRLDGPRDQPLSEIPGVVPSLANMPPGCRFHQRCPVAVARCGAQAPEQRQVRPGHSVACWMVAND